MIYNKEVNHMADPMRHHTKGNKQSDDALKDNHVARKTDEWRVL